MHYTSYFSCDIINFLQTLNKLDSVLIKKILHTIISLHHCDACVITSFPYPIIHSIPAFDIPSLTMLMSESPTRINVSGMPVVSLEEMILLKEMCLAVAGGLLVLWLIWSKLSSVWVHERNGLCS